MGLEDIYDSRLEPIYPEETDAYLGSIPAEEAYGIPAELARNPLSIVSYVKQALEANREALRDIETRRKAIAFRGSVLMGLVEECGEVVATLPPEVRKEMEEWSSRIQK